MKEGKIDERVVSMVLLFLIVYVAFGLVFNLLNDGIFFGGDHLGKDVLLRGIVWPFLMLNVGSASGNLGYAIAIMVFVALVVTMIWISNLVDNLLFPKRNI